MVRRELADAQRMAVIDRERQGAARRQTAGHVFGWLHGQPQSTESVLDRDLPDASRGQE